MNTIVAVFDDPEHAQRAVRALESAAVPRDCITVVGASQRTATDDGSRSDDRARGDAATEGENELMMGLAAMSIPAFGPVLATGGLITPMMGPVTGPIVRRGGRDELLLADLLAAGVSDEDAHDYADAHRGGATIVLVAASEADVDRVARALADCEPIECEHHHSSGAPANQRPSDPS